MKISRQDLIGLRWSDVDTKAGVIRKTRGKTKVEAEIPISAACAEALEVCRRRIARGEVVFLTPRHALESDPGRTVGGLPYSVSTVVRYFETAKKLAGITRRLRLHDLRHTFASRLASAGVSLQVIARALGHTSARMAERYPRPNADAMRSVRAALDRLISVLNSGPASGSSPESERTGLLRSS